MQGVAGGPQSNLTVGGTPGRNLWGIHVDGRGKEEEHEMESLVL